jgi:hypothetical protein
MTAEAVVPSTVPPFSRNLTGERDDTETDLSQTAVTFPHLLELG